MSMSKKWSEAVFTAALLAGVSAGAGVVQAGEYRSIDGSGNNIANPTWGETDTRLMRMASPAYEDGFSEPRGGGVLLPNSLPSGRAVSNAVSAQSMSVPNKGGVSDWIWQWGQFLDHDLDLTEGASPAEAFDIIVPLGDPDFSPAPTIGLNRSVYDTGTGVTDPRQQVNQITAYIDASNVYGSDQGRADEMRDVDGKLKTSAGNLLMLNVNGLPNANALGAPEASLFLAGDVRANEQVALTATHTLFMREHNRLAEELKMRLDGGDTLLIAKRDAAIAEVGNGVDDEGDFLYQSARKVIGAHLQSITYNEFLPVLLGDGAVGAYGGYDDTVDATISNEFSAAAYRYGHSQLSSEVLLPGDPAGSISLQNMFFDAGFIGANGIDSLLHGLALGTAQEVDTLIVDDVRNFLFGPPGAGGLDIAALDIQRVRDHGLSGLNDTRLDLGLTAFASFLEMTGGDVDLANAFASVYGDVDEVDLWIGGLAETHVSGALIGETFHHIIADQFFRLREGDRFFYLNDLDHILALAPDFEDTRLSDIIVRNTGISSIQSNVFLVPTPEPVTALLGLMGLGGVGAVVRRRR